MCFGTSSYAILIAKVFGSIFNAEFSDFSYGYRPGRSVQQAARQAQVFYQQGYKWQIDIDLHKFFDTVNQDILMERVSRKVRNKDLLKLIGRFLRGWRPSERSIAGNKERGTAG